jgi:hypothetical protein
VQQNKVNCPGEMEEEKGREIGSNDSFFCHFSSHFNLFHNFLVLAKLRDGEFKERSPCFLME